MPSAENKQKLRPAIFGMPFDALTERETLDRIFEFAASRGPRGCRIAATVNVDFIVNTYYAFKSAPRRPELAAVLRRAELVVADGMPLVWLSKLLGTPLPERVAGSDLVPMIAERAAREKVKLYFLGGAEEHTRRAAELLRARHPGLEIELDTPFVKLDAPDAAALDREICRKINASGASILLVGFGNPKQELWLERNRNDIDCNIAIGVGGTFNFIAGAVKRAPDWMRRSGTEWIYRIIQEPRRLWKRYFVGLFQFNLMALAAVWNRPRRGGAELVRDDSGRLRATDKRRFSPRALADILAAAETAPVRIADLSFRQKRQLRAHRMAHLVES